MYRILNILLCMHTFYVFYITLAWEPRVALSTHSYSCRVPALGGIFRFQMFSPIKVDQFKLNQNLRQIGQGVSVLWSDKQTEITTMYRYQIVCIVHYMLWTEHCVYIIYCEIHVSVLYCVYAHQVTILVYSKNLIIEFSISLTTGISPSPNINKWKGLAYK